MIMESKVLANSKFGEANHPAGDRRNDMANPGLSEAFCPYYRRAVELIGRRWTGAILRALASGVNRFSDIADTVPGLSDRMLSERLKELENEGIVVRTIHPETPVRIDYQLTDKGRSLRKVMEELSSWAYAWLAPSEEASHVTEDQEAARQFTSGAEVA